MLVAYLVIPWALSVLWYVWDDKYDRWMYFILIGLMLGGAVVSGLTGGLSFLTYTDSNTEWRLEQTETIVAMGDNPSTSGDFFLGSGVIEGSMVYVYYSDEGPGIYQFHKVDATCAQVHEVAGVAPRVETYERHFKVWGADHLLWQSVRSDTYRFYIPPGTLQQNLTIDLR